MDWLNIHRKTLASEKFLGCDPVQRATWLCLLAYCIDQENGGRIEEAGAWPDRKWQQVVRVTMSEVRDTCDLWSWDGACLVVWAYPNDKEEEVRRNRENGKRGGRPSKPRENQVVSSGLTTSKPPAPISAETEEEEEKEREGNRKGKEMQHAQAREQAGIPCSEFSPTEEHAGICALRNASLERQLSRFRALNPTATDTPQGWEARFRHFLARARPEVEQSPISPPAQRQEAKRPSWAIDRDLNDARKELGREQDGRKEARYDRNRFSMGQPEYRKYAALMAQHDERIQALQARIAELETERKSGNG